MVVGSAYTNSSFTAFATRPTVTELYALDIAPSKDQLWIQRPANNGTLIMPVSLDFDLGANAGFDIVGSDAPATSATSPARGSDAAPLSCGGSTSPPARRGRSAASARA